jgi:hypothetical protein
MRPVLRIPTIFITLVVAAAVATTAVFALGRAVHPDNPDVNLKVMIEIKRQLNRIAAHRGDPDVYSIAFLGDSTVIGYPEGLTVDKRLETVLASEWAGPSELRVESLSAMGMAPAAFYLLQDLINEAGPDIAIVTANLAVIRDPLSMELRRPELAGWVEFRRFYAALVTRDLHKFGVTADRLLLYKLFASTGVTPHWLSLSRQQARLGHLRESAERNIAERTGWTGETSTRLTRQVAARVESFDANDPSRRTAEGARRYMGELMAGIDEDHWVLGVLRAILDDFRARGTATILYIPPVNVERLRTVGVYDEAGLSRSLELLEHIAIETGAEFADLHDLLPDTVFRDGGGHFKYEPPYDGPRLVAAALAPYVQIQARAVARPH